MTVRGEIPDFFPAHFGWETSQAMAEHYAAGGLEVASYEYHNPKHRKGSTQSSGYRPTGLRHSRYSRARWYSSKAEMDAYYASKGFTVVSSRMGKGCEEGRYLPMILIPTEVLRDQQAALTAGLGFPVREPQEESEDANSLPLAYGWRKISEMFDAWGKAGWIIITSEFHEPSAHPGSELPRGHRVVTVQHGPGNPAVSLGSYDEIRAWYQEKDLQPANCGYTNGRHHANALQPISVMRDKAQEKQFAREQKEALAVAEEKSDAPSDSINHPSHYTSHPSGVECIEITRHMTFNCGNVFKYLWRNGLKDGEPSIKDMKKALWYLKDEIERLEKEGGDGS